MSRRTRIAVVGSRGYPYPSRVVDFVQSLPKDTVIVSGGAAGPDTIAQRCAEHRGLQLVLIPADWKRGRGAGLERNSLIVEIADGVAAFWDGESRGTLDTTQKALKAGKPVKVFRSGKEA